MIVQEIEKVFIGLYQSKPLIVRSPGRINIIGEHTDYNEGFVLPAAIGQAVYVAVDKRPDNRIRLLSMDFNESYETTISDMKPTGNWSTYILGVADQLLQQGYSIGGFNLILQGNVPIGAGLSSSAAVECATVFALNELFDLKIDRMEMVHIAQKAEHRFANVLCGIMDQFTSMFGLKDRVIKLDCRSLEYEYLPLRMEGYKIVLLNTNVKHSLVASEYNTRRQQCEQGVAWVKEHYPGVKTLRDVTLEMLDKQVADKSETVYRRCKYVVEETERLIGACKDLAAGNIPALGAKLFATHTGLSKEYEVSCRELDVLVEAVKNNPDVLGARMMGGGFGGCTINIVKEAAVEDWMVNIGKIYKEKTGLTLSAYRVQTDNGTELVVRKDEEVFNLKEHAHTRLNILTGDKILVSPHRTKRPWQGKTEHLPETNRPSYVADCYLCPGNRRADGSVNPNYTESFVFTNDYSALTKSTPTGSLAVEGLLVAESEKGICKVISFSPDHSLTLPLLSEAAIQAIIRLWIKEYSTLAAYPDIRYIQIFENKGEIMGCSNPHPHGQIWSQSSSPVEIIKETKTQQKHFIKTGKSLLSDYLCVELQQKERIVLENEHFVALVPFWAVWPYETMIISKRHVQTMLRFTEDEITAYAAILKKLTIKYDNLFNISFPYSAGIHQAPVNDGDHPEWHWHMHFYPPLLRSATIKKFMVGYEMLANPQRDITAERAAAQLRNASEIHYTSTNR